jgi:hypothetical protein
MFKSIWNILLIFLLMYTATFMPYKICFVDNASQASEMLDTVVDFLFAFDIIVNFLSAVEESDGTISYAPTKIAQKYIKSWFFFDLIAVFPFQQIISGVTVQQSN